LRHNTGNHVLAVLVIEHLTIRGIMDERCSTSRHLRASRRPGQSNLFDESKVTRLFTKIKAINDSAMA